MPLSKTQSRLCSRIPRISGLPNRAYASSFFGREVFRSYSGKSSHLSGMFWLVPSGSARLMLIGRTPSSSSIRAMSIGERVGSLMSNSTGAPIETWSALAPTTRARSKRVSFGGPISIFSGSLVLTCSLFATFSGIFRCSRSLFRL